MADLQMREKPLRAAAPSLYEFMLEVLAKQNIHPYDVEATAVHKENSLELSVRYGASFSQAAVIQLDRAESNKPGEKTRLFFEEIVEKCKKQLVADYFKMMKP